MSTYGWGSFKEPLRVLFPFSKDMPEDDRAGTQAGDGQSWYVAGITWRITRTSVEVHVNDHIVDRVENHNIVENHHHMEDHLVAHMEDHAGHMCSIYSVCWL